MQKFSPNLISAQDSAVKPNAEGEQNTANGKLWVVTNYQLSANKLVDGGMYIVQRLTNGSVAYK